MGAGSRDLREEGQQDPSPDTTVPKAETQPWGNEAGAQIPQWAVDVSASERSGTQNSMDQHHGRPDVESRMGQSRILYFSPDH